MKRLAIVWGLAALTAGPLAADIVHLEDVIVDGSLCVGFDCVEGESFAYETLRLKENILQIHFWDTSSASSFPSNDWRIRANDPAAGGAEEFSIDDISAGQTPFTLEAGAPSHSLFVSERGRVGFGTSTPATELHVVTGNIPAVRLEQDGSAGWTPQTWDVGGNEQHFFVEDITNGSTLPFEIAAGAPGASLTINNGGEVGLGTAAPKATLHLKKAGRPASMIFENGGNGAQWKVGIGIVPPTVSNPASHDDFVIARVGGGAGIGIAGPEFGINDKGHVFVKGTKVHPDYVFDPDFELMPLDELKRFVQRERRLPNVPTAETVRAEGLDLNLFITRLLEKVEELTLYVIEQHERIQELESRVPAGERGS